MANKIPKIVRDIRKNPPQPVNWAYQKNISHSQISIYKSCPYRWKLQYVDKTRKFSDNIHSVFGKAIHTSIQGYLDVMYGQSIVKANELDLEKTFQESFMEEYNKSYKSNNKIHFSSAVEMREFYDEGVEILRFFKKKRGRYFSKKGWSLVGCEIPIVIQPNRRFNNVLYMGYLDIVLYHKDTNRFHIIDLKTSTRGWGDREKKDIGKVAQIIAYKSYFASQYNIPIEDVTVEFLVLKRKLIENCDFPQTRIQSFIPASGKNKIKQSQDIVDAFLNECFNESGSIREREYPKTPEKWSCTFCPYSDDEELCGLGKKLFGK